MAYRNGSHPGGSTATNDPNSTRASDASTPSGTFASGDETRPDRIVNKRQAAY
jgi:hypothetical protein